MLALALALCTISPAWAATGTVDLTITPICTRGITVALAAPTAYDFVSVAFNTTTHSTRAVAVTNTGTCKDTWQLQAADVTGTNNWTIGSAAAANTYVLRSVFNSGMPGSSAFTASEDDLTGSLADCVLNGKFETSSGQACQLVNPAGSANMWFQLVTPTSTNDTGIQHTIRVTVSTQP